MMHKRIAATSSFAVLFLLVGLCPRGVCGSGPGVSSLPGTAFAIGTVESLGSAAIDGRPVSGATPLWDGATVQAPLNTNARVSIYEAGTATLAPGALARFALKAGSTLVASVVSGDVLIDLKPQSRAYVEALGAMINASPGSAFRVSATSAHPIVIPIRGDVSVEQQSASQRRYVVRPVGLGSNISVRARSTRQIQVQVTDENDKSVPDIPILFALSGKGFGSLGGGLIPRTAMTVTTDARGIASVSFEAGDTTGNETISATVEGTRYSWIGQISITPAGGGFWSARNSLIIVAVAAGAGVGLYFGLRNNREPIVAAPPPRVEP